MTSKLVILTASYVAVESISKRRDRIELRIDGENSGPAYMLGDDDATDVPLPKGDKVVFCNIDLAEIQLKGTPGDKIAIYGGDGAPTVRLV
jgi:hypothetical protein